MCNNEIHFYYTFTLFDKFNNNKKRKLLPELQMLYYLDVDISLMVEAHIHIHLQLSM